MCQIESSFRGPALSACEPSPQVFAARAVSGGGGPETCSHAGDFQASSPSICRTRQAGHSAYADSGAEGGVHGKTASRLDRGGAPQRPAKRDGYQRLGGKGLRALAIKRLCSWVMWRPREDTKCGWRPCGIVWRRKKWLTHTEFWCPRRKCFLPN
jgi:hypothetical protein